MITRDRQGVSPGTNGARKVRLPRAALFVLLSLLSADLCRAAGSSSEPAALLVFPFVAVDSTLGQDTIIHLANTSDQQIDIRCVYEDTALGCRGGRAGERCLPSPGNCSGTCGVQTFARQFALRLTALQPIAWNASQGLEELPLDGERIGVDGQSNIGSIVPPVRVVPFSGVLRCFVVSTGTDVEGRNVLLGSATVEEFRDGDFFDSSQYNAIGFGARAIHREENVLILGGPSGEFEGCPGRLVVQHVFDAAPLVVTVAEGEVERQVATTLVTAACSQDFATHEAIVADVEIINEFEQRTAIPGLEIEPHAALPLSSVDADVPERSLFHIAVQGTVTGISYWQAREGYPGLIGVALEKYADPNGGTRNGSTAANLGYAGERREADVIAFRGVPTSPTATATQSSTVEEPTPTPTTELAPCRGDCNADRQVSVDELVLGIQIALAKTGGAECGAFDTDGNQQVSVDELLAAVGAALTGCDTQ